MAIEQITHGFYSFPVSVLTLANITNHLFLGSPLSLLDLNSDQSFCLLIPYLVLQLIFCFFVLFDILKYRSIFMPFVICFSQFTMQDKPTLFRSFYKWLKPGGQLLITDYCKSAGSPSAEFADYIKKGGYYIHDMKAYEEVRTCVLSVTSLSPVWFHQNYLNLRFFCMTISLCSIIVRRC